MRTLKGLALLRASHSGKIALAGSRRLRFTLAAAPVLFAHAVVIVAKIGRIGNPINSPIFAAAGFYNCPWGQLQDQNPHFIIAAHAVATATGDKQWLLNILPAIEAIATYIESSMSNGVFISPGSGLANGARSAGNWYVAC